VICLLQKKPINFKDRHTQTNIRGDVESLLEHPHFRRLKRCVNFTAASQRKRRGRVQEKRKRTVKTPGSSHREAPYENRYTTASCDAAPQSLLVPHTTGILCLYFFGALPSVIAIGVGGAWWQLFLQLLTCTFSSVCTAPSER
jgi:hypothetical protein